MPLCPSRIEKIFPTTKRLCCDLQNGTARSSMEGESWIISGVALLKTGRSVSRPGPHPFARYGNMNPSRRCSAAIILYLYGGIGGTLWRSGPRSAGNYRTLNYTPAVTDPNKGGILMSTPRAAPTRLCVTNKDHLLDPIGSNVTQPLDFTSPLKRCLWQVVARF